ncbi:family 10 glycosylhydrolase [Flavobacterium branchiarum]|uniref:Glycoside hydrolase family 10 protein n=1 Tax=Flavobacterium branchiarum TaxID=1114870 RepID=A0ABV5FM93_9FLAO|nr:family 10 glycosylhydrolase [Flavobacterium branchiarum]MDN3674663.1 family 10 glycosylhydrolase [Flavobacterium branchiarum]
MKSIKLLILVLLFQTNLFSQESPKREMRAAWISTVDNIDWPSKPGLSDKEMKAEMIVLLDNLRSYNLNTVVFQIRPTADAYYKSTKEPASHWITGKQGVAPGFDPLQLVIDEAGKRGMSVHVWLNPYRVQKDTTKEVLAKTHLYFKKPELFVTYGKTRYFNPGFKETRNFVASVVGEIVRNYDIQAIHMDDYFYPYKIAGQEFPDQVAFEKEPRQFKDKDDWRRDNVDLIIKQIRDTIIANKPEVEFGISPFGVWRNKAKDSEGSNTMAGATNYDDLYANILKWQKENWIDYVTPQLYWHIGFDRANFEVLAKWWAERKYGANVYIGHGEYKISKTSKEEEWRSPNQIVKQIEMIRSLPLLDGSMHFTANVFKRMGDTLRKPIIQKQYKYIALTPEANRITRIKPERPVSTSITQKGDQMLLTWKPGAHNQKFVIYRFNKGKITDFSNPENIYYVTTSTKLEVPSANFKNYTYAITALSPTQIESIPIEF